MRTLQSIIAALVFAFAGNSLLAADESKPTNEQKLQQQQKESTQEPARQQTTGDLTEQEQAYLSALKKCEAMSGAEKQHCVERTKQEFHHH